MARKFFKPTRRPPSFKPQRRDIRRWLLLVPLLLASRPERVAASFTACGPGRGAACVVDGDTFKLGDRKIRVTGIDAPELAEPKCPAELALARRSAERLRALLNQGEFEMVGHRLQQQDRHGRDLMVIRRGDQSIGAQMIDEGLAHRYIGSKSSWC